MNQYERDALAKFKQNDEEIDEMLDGVIQQLDAIKGHAEDIGSEINKQEKLIKSVTQHVDDARVGLELQNNEFHDLLNQYRQSGKCWKDMCMCITLMILIGLNVTLLKWKGIF